MIFKRPKKIYKGYNKSISWSIFIRFFKRPKKLLNEIVIEKEINVCRKLIYDYP